MTYIDGFALPMPSAQLDNYRQVVEAVARIWKEHGALDYREFVGDDMSLEGTRTFMDALATHPGEVVIFGWVSFESREARDRANEKVAGDPRMAALMGADDTGFDPTRMAYGGFRPFV